MREATAYVLLSEADALVVGALGALIIEDHFRGTFPDQRLAALLSLVIGTVSLALLFYIHNRLWYGKFTVKGLGENSRGVYSLVSALVVMALTAYCVFGQPSLAGSAVLFIIALAVQGAMWLRAINGAVSANKLWRSQNRWEAVGWPLVIGIDLICGWMIGGTAGVAVGALLGWAPLYANLSYSMARVTEYGNRFSKLFLPALLSFDMSLVFAAFTGWYFNEFSIALATSVMVCAALIVAELALVLGLDRTGLLKAGPKKLDGAAVHVH